MLVQLRRMIITTAVIPLSDLYYVRIGYYFSDLLSKIYGVFRNN